MMRPHLLDEMFETPEKIRAICEHPKFKEALQAALKMHQSRTALLQKQTELIGSSPAQAARQTFLKILGLGVVDYNV